MRAHTTLTSASLAVLLTTPLSWAQWDPENGLWGKSHETDLRVMTWNIQDAICSTNNQKTDAFNAWNALVRIIVAMEPDIVILQECGDNSGNGTGGSGDSVSSLETTLDLFINGGNDPFVGGTVGSYIKKFDPDMDFPYVFVSSAGDGFNRNVIISRYPFADLNQDLLDDALISNIVVFADGYAPGINGGVRGYMFAEIDLPDEVYAGDVVVGNGHLKAFGGCSDQQEREEASQNVAYWIDYFYNGAGTGLPDPNDKIPFDDQDTVILGPDTPVVWGGDLNQKVDGSGCFTKSPAEWMTEALIDGGTDGTDRDGTDSTWDLAAHPLTGDTSTQSSSKIDFLMWQDSIATARREFIFRSSGIAQADAPYPVPVDTFPPHPSTASTTASDHRPVIVDLILPLADVPVECMGDVNGDLVVDSVDLNLLLASFGVSAGGDLDGDEDTDSGDLNILLGAFGNECEG